MEEKEVFEKEKYEIKNLNELIQFSKRFNYDEDQMKQAVAKYVSEYGATLEKNGTLQEIINEAKQIILHEIQKQYPEYYPNWIDSAIYESIAESFKEHLMKLNINVRTFNENGEIKRCNLRIPHPPHIIDRFFFNWDIDVICPGRGGSIGNKKLYIVYTDYFYDKESNLQSQVSAFWFII